MVTYHWLWLQHGEESKIGRIEAKHEKGGLSRQLWHVLPDVIVDLGFVVEVRDREFAFGDFVCRRKCAPNVMLQCLYFSGQSREHDAIALLDLTGLRLTGAFEERFPPLSHGEDGLRALPPCQFLIMTSAKTMKTHCEGFPNRLFIVITSLDDLHALRSELLGLLSARIPGHCADLPVTRLEQPASDGTTLVTSRTGDNS